MTGGDIIVLAVLGAVVGLILGQMHRDRKKGRCCGGCAGCSGCGERENCHEGNHPNC